MNIRHGDMALIGIDKLPQGLTASDTTVLMKGSGGNDHSFKNGVFYPKPSGDNVIGYFEAQGGCYLLHPDHGKKKGNTKLRTANVTAGLYEVRRQNEQTHEGMRPVVD